MGDKALNDYLYLADGYPPMPYSQLHQCLWELTRSVEACWRAPHMVDGPAMLAAQLRLLAERMEATAEWVRDG